MQLQEIGINTAKEKQFLKKGLSCVEDLTHFFPIRYNDYSVITGLLPLPNCSVTILRVNDVKKYNNSVPLVMALCTDIYTGDRVNVSWFHQSFIFGQLWPLIGHDVLVAGKAVYNEAYNSYGISAPTIFTDNVSTGAKIYPVYSKISGMSEEYLSDKIQKALMIEDMLRETCPQSVVKKHNLISTKEMLAQLHFPSNPEALQKATDRAIFDDLLYFAICLESNSRKLSKGSQYGIRTLRYTKKIISELPFELTEDQKNAVNSMIDSMKKGRRINALVQGDVGCGKTIIAFLMMLAAVDNGYQAAIMAPTQVLAKQHYEDIQKITLPLGIKVAFFGGGPIRKKEKEALLAGISSGDINIAVGTHGLLNKDIHFKNLAITVTDEEHKFGVLQRNSLVEKAAAGVHSITMSATPIPRSLAQVVYGDDIQLYTIKTMPSGRKPVKTIMSKSITGTQKSLLSQLEQGRQAYVVCPMIDKNEDMDGVKSVEEISEIYASFFEPLGYKVGVLTGRNTPDETKDTISQFKDGKIDVLVSTTVIEVGVNVPNASVIVIHNAERFGLSGLHQLRGRVGRGNHQSYCVLLSEDTENERLIAMVNTNDGFKIAEEDLRLRGAGDFIGTKQSGDDKYIALMMSYPELYQEIQKTASDMLDEDSECCIMEQVRKRMQEIPQSCDS